MRFRSVRSLAAALALAATVVMAADAIAQTPTQTAPTADQLKMIESLPQAQRDALLQQAAGQSGVLGGSSATQQTPGGQIVVTDPSLIGAEGNENRSARAALPKELKIKGFEQVLIDLSVPLPSETRSALDEKKINELRARILARNPYDLSESGILQIPGFAPIGLLGLRPLEVQQRISIEPQLREFRVGATVLPVQAQGTRALKPFGYDMFRSIALANVPGTDIPVPDTYKVGPGDVFDVQLYGQQSKTYSLPVGRDGTVAFPELGPIAVGGMEYKQSQNLLEKRVRQQLVGTQVRIRLNDLRSMRILVVGDAEQPGPYVVSSLAGVTNALFASGGVKSIGSLRGIEVRRGGRLLRRLDLYDVLLHGDTSNDVTLESGDTVFVPPVGATVGIAGDVRRPAIYELNRERTLSQVIALAGGLAPTADLSAVVVERVGARGERLAAAVDMGSAEGQNFAVQTGDTIRVAAVRPVVDNGITVEGQVYRPGSFAWRAGLRISDILRSVDELKPRADEHYIFVRREAPDTRRVSVVSADLTAALAARGSTADIPLAARDRVIVFDLDAPRDRLVDPILDEIRTQSRPEDVAGVVYVDGRVNSAGAYPLEPSMHVSDLLRAAGGLEDAAYVNSAELTRYTVSNGEQRTVEIKSVDIAAVRRGDSSADVLLQPYDLLSVKLTPEWGRQEKIEIVGEVRFPGTYLIRRSETLSSVLERAGGLTTVAFPQGAVFTREELKQRERDQLDRLATRLQADLATLSVQSSQTNQGNAQALAAGQGLLDQLKQAKPVGRLVIDLGAIAAGAHTAYDLTLRNGDRLVVPRSTQEVSVFGEVQNPTSHLYRVGQTRDRMIELSGGMTAHADRKRAYVVRADGSVEGKNSRWGSSKDVPVHPGDSVVVPVDAEKMRPLPMWTAITTIIYNLAIAAAAITHF